MKRNYPQSIAQVLESVFKDKEMESTMLQHRALAAWPQVVGPVINRATVERRVQSGVMYLRIPSGAIRAELSMHRTTLIQSLNRAVGADVINEIRFF